MTNDILNTKNFDCLIDATLQQQTSGCYYREALYACFMKAYCLSKQEAMNHIKERFAGMIETTTQATGKGFAGMMSKEFSAVDEWIRSADSLNWFTITTLDASSLESLSACVNSLATHLETQKVNYRNSQKAKEREQQASERKADKAKKEAEAEEKRQAEIQADEAERIACGYDETAALQAVRWYSRLTDSDKVKTFEKIEKMYKKALQSIRKPEAKTSQKASRKAA